jgi:MoaA/NifB/PqqE/SkfB family radical SAM enzyme
MHEYKNIVRLYKELGLDGGLGWQYLQNMEVYTSFYSDDMKTQLVSDHDKAALQMKASQDPEIVALVAREQQKEIPSFYSSLLASPTESCPWLSNGLYVNMNGQATGCAYMKNVARDGFGTVTPETVQGVFQRRDQLEHDLSDGNIPVSCKGCPMATAAREKAILKKYHSKMQAAAK